MSSFRSGSPPAVRPAEDEGPGLIASLWRYRFLVVGVPLAAAVLGYLLSLLQPPAYRASAQVFLANPRDAAVFGEQVAVEPGAYAAQQAQLMSSRSVEDRTSALLGGRLDPEELEKQVDIELVEEGGQLVEVVATDRTAEGAQQIADSLVQAYRGVVAERVAQRAEDAAAQLDPQRQDLQNRIADLQAQLATEPGDTVVENQIDALNDQLIALESRAQELLANAGAIGDGVEVAEPAVAEEDPVAPAPLRNAALLALLGACAAGAYAYWRAGRVREVTGRDDPAGILGAPLLGEIPNYRRQGSETLAGQLALDPQIAESYQFVLASIEYALEGAGGASLLVTSAGPGDGKTTTALQLAMAASRDGRRVVLVDADIRAQGLTRMLGVADRTGITELALHHLEVEASVHYLPVADELLLPVVTAGGRVEDPGSFFRAPGFRKAVQRIKDEAELVMLDSSPLLAVADTSVIAGQVDGIVLVVDRGTRIDQLQLIRQRLAFAATPLLGYVYNRSRAPGLAAYGYGYGAADRELEA